MSQRSRGDAGTVVALRKKAIVWMATSVLGAGALGVAFAGPAAADTPGGAVVVTPANQQGWSQTDTRTGGNLTYVADAGAPLGTSALQLSTDATNDAKVNYMHAAPAGMALSAVTSLSYSTRQLAASIAAGDASFQLAIDVNGSADGGFTTLVYEPYWQNKQDPDAAPVQANAWRQWDVASGYFWSSRTVGGLTAGSGGPPLYTLADVHASDPNATVLGFGVDVGSYNPSYTINVDAIEFNGTTYNFELTNQPTAKSQCKDQGYVDLTDADGTPFTNQGQCVAFVNHHDAQGADGIHASGSH